MKGKIFIAACFCLHIGFCFAGKRWQAKASVNKPTVLFIITFQDRPPVITQNGFIDPAEREYVHFLNTADDHLYKELGTTAIAVVKLKAKAHPLSLQEVFDRYKIPIKFRKLNVKYNEEILNFPETILISSNQISSVKIERSANNSFISIIGTDYRDIKKIKSEQKRGRAIN